MRLDQLTFTRFLAAASIVVFHYGHDTFLFTNAILAPIFSQANIGVSYFFLLSGFVMVVANYKKDMKVKEFYLNRIARIYPLYLLALLLVIIFNVANGIAINKSEVFLSVFALQAWIPRYPLTLNFPGWSLSIEMFFYAVFPYLLLLIYRRYTLKQWAPWAIVLWLGSLLGLEIGRRVLPQFIPSIAMDLLYYHPFMHLNVFVAGNLAGYLFFKFSDSVNIKWNGLVLVLLVALLYLLLRCNLPICYHDGFLAIVFLPAVILLALNKGAGAKLLNLPILVFLGDISYGIYILQVPVHLFCLKLFSYYQLPLNFYAYFCLLVFFSAASYLFVEKPLRVKIASLGR
ncbi:MAG: acyltransferase [Chitinophagales bacterium]